MDQYNDLTRGGWPLPIRPCTSTTSIVSSWHSEIDVAFKETVLPAGRATVVVVTDNAGAAIGGWAVIHGPASQPRTVCVPAKSRAVGVELAPGTVRDLGDGRVSAVADQPTPLDRVFQPTEVDALRMAIWNAESSAAARDATVDFVARRFDSRSSPDRAFVLAAESMLTAGAGVASVAATLDVDRRLLAVLFRRQIGLGLKRYARVRRFERAVNAMRQRSAPSLAIIAIDCGYADQAHMTRDFASFAGFSPGTLHRTVGPTPMHVLHDETFKTAAAVPR